MTDITGETVVITDSMSGIGLGLTDAEDTRTAICTGYALTPLGKVQLPDSAKSCAITEEVVMRDACLAVRWSSKSVTVGRPTGVIQFRYLNAAENITGISLPIDSEWTVT